MHIYRMNKEYFTSFHDFAKATSDKSFTGAKCYWYYETARLCKPLARLGYGEAWLRRGIILLVHFVH